MSLRDRLPKELSPSSWLKELFLGSVGVVAIKIAYGYLKALESRPDLLAKMGSPVIIGLLSVSVLGVLANRAIDGIVDVFSKFVDAFSMGIDRLSSSAEQTARSSAESAASVRQIAEAQTLAASKDDRHMQQVENLIGVLVIKIKQIANRLHAQDRALERLENHAGINRPTSAELDDVEEDGERNDV